MAPEPRWAPNVSADVEHRGWWVGAGVAETVDGRAVVEAAEAGADVLVGAVVDDAGVDELVVGTGAGVGDVADRLDDGAVVTLALEVDPLAGPELVLQELKPRATTDTVAAPRANPRARTTIS